MGTHTPGPWSIEPEWSERAGGDVAIVNRDHAGDDWDVCSVHSTEANARVIAAAPSLLFACKEALLHLTDEGGECFSGDAAAVSLLRSAIAQATGESA